MSSTLHAAPDNPPTPEVPLVAAPPTTPAGATRSGVSTHIDESERAYRGRRRRRLAFVVLFSLVDAIIIKTTWNQVLLTSEIVSWVIAVMTALGGAFVMWESGSLAASVRVYPHRMKAVLSAIAVLAWVALGSGLFWLRWNAAALAGSAVVVEGQTTEDSSTRTHQLMAVVMIALYLLPGVLAWIDGFLLGHPVEAHQRRTGEQVRTLNPQLAAAEAEAVKVDQLLQLHVDEIALVGQRAREAQLANAALAAELRAFAREEIGRRLGTPNAAGMTHPDEQPASTRGDRARHDTRGTYPE